MDIDFVIPWVDGSDLEWRKSKNKYSGKIDEPVDITDARYRDWDYFKILVSWCGEICAMGS